MRYYLYKNYGCRMWVGWNITLLPVNVQGRKSIGPLGSDYPIPSIPGVAMFFWLFLKEEGSKYDQIV